MGFGDLGSFGSLAAVFGFKMVFRGPGRYLERFLRLVASSWLNMSPWRAMGTRFMAKTAVLGHVLCLFSVQRRDLVSAENGDLFSPQRRDLFSAQRRDI